MRLKYILLCCILAIFICSCKTTSVDSTDHIKHDSKYDSEHPSSSISKDLENISNSVKKLDIIAFYATYYFPESSNISSNDITKPLIKQYSNTKVVSHESVSGTASVIYKVNQTIGLLTCAHVIDFPDTSYSYFDAEKTRVQAVSIKIKQQNHISGLPSGEPIEVVIQDKKKDIAILLKKLDNSDNSIQPLNYPIGTVEDLQWGSIVYIIGFPLGNLMVTRGITSISEKMKSGFFVTDALYNHGISGSPVFAIRDGVPNFELVGIASSAAAQETKLLVPDMEFENENRTKSVYNGDIFVDNNKLISYGVTYSVTINEIITFIDSNEEMLNKKGFSISSFFK